MSVPCSHFLKYFVEESLKKMSLCELQNNNMNACTHEVSDKPVNLTPRLLSPVTEFSYKNPKTLNVYPAKADVENFFLLSEQFAESLHNTASQIVFEIRATAKKSLSVFMVRSRISGLLMQQ